MEQALIIGASGGIGTAIAQQLEGQGAAVTRLSRSDEGLEITDEASVRGHLGALKPGYDLILVASGGLEVAGHGPEKTLRALTPEAMMAQFALNAVGPALVIKHAQRLLARDRRSVLAVLSARVGSIGDNRLGGWISYRSAKAAVNQVVRTASIEMSRTHPQALCVALHPGTVQTDLTRNYLGRHPSVLPEQAAQNLLQVMAGLGPSESGGFFDWAGKPVPW